MRDGCSCVATGVLGDTTEDGRSLSKGSVLTIVPILHQSSAGWEEEDSLVSPLYASLMYNALLSASVTFQNDDMALANEKFTNLRVAHFLQAYCQMDLRFGLPVDDPRNCLLLSWRAASTFRECRWTLHPTEVCILCPVHGVTLSLITFCPPVHRSPTATESRCTVPRARSFAQRPSKSTSPSRTRRATRSAPLCHRIRTCCGPTPCSPVYCT